MTSLTDELIYMHICVCLSCLHLLILEIKTVSPLLLASSPASPGPSSSPSTTSSPTSAVLSSDSSTLSQDQLNRRREKQAAENAAKKIRKQQDEQARGGVTSSKQTRSGRGPADPFMAYVKGVVDFFINEKDMFVGWTRSIIINVTAEECESGTSKTVAGLAANQGTQDLKLVTPDQALKALRQRISPGSRALYYELYKTPTENRVRHTS